ncbi:MAG TPA: hypothetical protein VFB49_03105 [Patescibacteria group bacterium]|nr:hypothetical protein [Patescibacteria group bacterium]
MSSTVDDLLDSINQALALLKQRTEARFGVDVENLLRVKKVLEGLDPDEVDALLEDDGESDRDEEE